MNVQIIFYLFFIVASHPFFSGGEASYLFAQWLLFVCASSLFLLLAMIVYYWLSVCCKDIKGGCISVIRLVIIGVFPLYCFLLFSVIYYGNQ